MPSSIERTLNYNEQKVNHGKAECIYAHNFLKEADEMNFYEKRFRYTTLRALNKRAVTNTVHISLNFHPDERLEKSTLVEIASLYMDKIGFAAQPYLVYQHLDAGHPHIHIVTTNIQSNGKRIALHNIGKHQSVVARKEIEERYGLKKAEGQKKKQTESLQPVLAQKAHYGKSPVKSAIVAVLHQVLTTYRYASLPELNAILKQYNIIADRGRVTSRMYQKRGLVYRILDEKGEKIGVPIKASSIYSKPTLAYLERRFKENEVLKTPYKTKCKAKIDWALIKSSKKLQAFQQALEKEKVNLVVRQNKQGIIYGLTYIDYESKSVFNGSDIGKEYCASAILKKLGLPSPIQKEKRKIELKPSQREPAVQPGPSKRHKPIQQTLTILQVIGNPIEQPEPVPYELKKTQKRKRRHR